VPEHAAAPPVYTPLLVEGAAATMRTGGLGYGFDGYYDVDLAASLDELVESRLDDLSFNVTAVAAVAAYVTREEGARAYGRAQNLRGTFATAYDDALGDVDVLAMPTTPQRSLPYDPDAHGADRFAEAVRPSPNTLPFNMTGHPAVSVPCGTADGLPVGLQLVGPKFADDRALAAAGTVEKLVERRTP
jgi:amidase